MTRESRGTSRRRALVVAMSLWTIGCGLFETDCDTDASAGFQGSIQADTTRWSRASGETEVIGVQIRGSVGAECPVEVEWHPSPGSRTNVAVSRGTTLGEPAEVSWTMPTQPSTATLKAVVIGAIPGLSITIPRTVVAGPPAAMIRVAGDSQSAPAATPLTVLPAVSLMDKYGNPAAGWVRFAVVAGGGQVAPPSQAQSDSSGVATAPRWILGPLPGVNKLTASLLDSDSAVPPVEFTAFGRAATACSIDHMVAWYPLDSTATDASGTGNHGTLPPGAAPTPALDRHDQPGRALAFDGVDDRVDIGDRFNNLALPITIAVWILQPTAARGDFRALLATDDQPGQYAGAFLMVLPTGQLSISYGSGGPSNAPFRRTFESNGIVPPDRWIHVTAVIRGPTDMALYADGVPLPGAYSGAGGPMVHSSAPARVGSFQLVPANKPWLGRLDEVRLYGCALDGARIDSLSRR